MKLLITFIVSYLLGSISTGVLLSRFIGHVDIRKQGSGNAGTTNMLRVMGKKYALLTLAGDMLKGIVSVLIGGALVGGTQGQMLGALGAILGHNYPFYLKFKGGKGIACTAGLIGSINWLMIAIGLTCFLIPFLVSISKALYTSP